LIVFLTCMLALACLGGFGSYSLWHAMQRDPAPETFQAFWEAWEHVNEYYYEELPSAQDRTYGAIRGALELLDDPYTVLVEPRPRELERDDMRGLFGGIGVDLWRNGDGNIVLSPYPDSPAERGGLLTDDVLLSVDDQPVTAETPVDHVRAQLHGEVGTSVQLTISRPPTLTLPFTITREEIQVPSVSWRILDDAPDIGYVHVEGFTERTGDELVAALRELEQSQVPRLILDLRGNYGGLVDAAVTVASQFLDDGIVLREQWKSEKNDRTFSVRRGGIATDIPLAVLVDGGTASAAEIVAGALQDHDRGPLIGEPTFGKGSVQLIYELSDGSSLHVTTALWLTPNRNQIQDRGLTPDISVERGSNHHDAQLEQAIAYLQQATGPAP
jgi:carboxyl-terminal processing protease